MTDTVTLPRDLVARIAGYLREYVDCGPPGQRYPSQQLMDDRSAIDDATAAQPAPVREGVEDEDDAEIDRILAMSGDEIRAELIADGHDPDELERQHRLQLDGLLRLAADRERWRSEAASWRRVAERLETEKQSLREALKPFAAILAKGEPVGPIPRGLLDRSLTRQDLRRATEALAAAPPVPEPVAPPAGEDLAALSAAATPGRLFAAGSVEFRRGPDDAEWYISDGKGNLSGCDVSKQDAQFWAALVNAYRAGKLIPAPTQPAAQGEPVAREAILAVVRAAWALVDNTGHHDLLPLAINRDDWNDLAARLAALKSLLPDEELPADPPHAVAYFWPARASIDTAGSPAAPAWVKAYEAECRRTGTDFDAQDCIAENFPQIVAPQPAATGRPSVEEVARAMARHQVHINEITYPPHKRLSEESCQRAEDAGWKQWTGFAGAVLALLAPARGDGTRAAEDVLAERRRQVEAEGWTSQHDDQHTERELGLAAACYASAVSPTHLDPKWSLPRAVRLWPWDEAWWKPSYYRRNLVKAGALILAEIERIDRAAGDKRSPS